MPEAKRDEVPLPEPVGRVFHDGSEFEDPWVSTLDAYTADQLREYGRQCAQAALESTSAELEALRKDAARYRRLRAGIARTTGGPRAGRIEVFRWVDRCEGEQLKGEALDAAVDAALTQGGK